MTTINLELNLNKKKLDLLEKLEKNTSGKKEKFLIDLINGKTTWEELIDLNYVLEREKDPNRKFLSGDEAKEYLKNLYLTNPQQIRKPHRGLQS